MLLQSIDTDGIADNGIQVSKEVSEAFNNATFTIDEVNIEDSAFNDKYKAIMGNDFNIDFDKSNNHALNSLKKEIINKLSPDFFEYIENHSIHDLPNHLGSGLNPKDYIQSLQSKMRAYFMNHLIVDLLTNDINMLDDLIEIKNGSQRNVLKRLDTANQKWRDIIGLSGLIKDGYKSIEELKSFKNTINAATNTQLNLFEHATTSYPVLTTNFAKGIAEEYMLDTFLTEVGLSDSVKNKILSCTDLKGFGALECFTVGLGEAGNLANKLYYGLAISELRRKQFSLEVAYDYLSLFYELNTTNHPNNINVALNSISENSDFDSFNQNSDDDLENALDLLFRARKNSSLIALYNFDYAKKTITEYQEIMQDVVNSYMNIDNELLQYLNNGFLDLHISLEPDDNLENNKYKACISIENISNTYLKSIYGDISYSLNGNDLGKTTITLDSMNSGDYHRECSDIFDVATNNDLLALGLIQVDYKLNYTPSIHNSSSKIQEGVKYFEIDNYIISLDNTSPIIITNKILRVTPSATVKLDASSTTSLDTSDSFSYKWTYLSSDKAQVGLTNQNSAIASFTAPDIPNDKRMLRLSFQVEATSNNNGSMSTQDVYVYIENEKQDTKKLQFISETYIDNCSSYTQQDCGYEVTNNIGTINKKWIFKNVSDTPVNNINFVLREQDNFKGDIIVNTIESNKIIVNPD